MAGIAKRTDPASIIVGKTAPAGTAGTAGAIWAPIVTVVAALSTAGATGNANFLSWINPESGTIAVTNVGIYWLNATATGTGTFDMGVSADGTGSNDNIFDGATMSDLATILVSRRGRTGTEGGGTKGVSEWFVLGPGGTGTNNSIVAKTSETATTAVGRAIVQYFLVTGT